MKDEPRSIPIGIPEQGVFKALSPSERISLSQGLERHAAALIRASGSTRNLQSAQAYVSDVVGRVALNPKVRFKGNAKLAKYCKNKIRWLINDDLRNDDIAFDGTEAALEELVRSGGDAALIERNDPEQHLILAEEIRQCRLRIREMIVQILSQLTPGEIRRFYRYLNSADEGVCKVIKKGVREGSLDLSPKALSESAGIPIDTVNKDKRRLRDVAARMGSFRRLMGEIS